MAPAPQEHPSVESENWVNGLDFTVAGFTSLSGDVFRFVGSFFIFCSKGFEGFSGDF